MEEKVLANLITLYTNKGISVEKLLNSPIYQRLPIQQKINVLKRYGEQAKAGVKWDSDDIKKLLLTLGLGALAVATIAGAYKMHNSANFVVNERLRGVTDLMERAALNAQRPTIGQAIISSSIPVLMAGAEASSFMDTYKKKRNLYRLDTNDNNKILSYISGI